MLVALPSGFLRLPLGRHPRTIQERELAPIGEHSQYLFDSLDPVHY